MALRSPSSPAAASQHKEDVHLKYAERAATLLSTRAVGRESVDWQRLAAAGLPYFREEECTCILEFERIITANAARLDDLYNWLKENGAKLVSIFCSLLTPQGAVSVLQQYVLVLVSKLIEVGPQVVFYFHSMRNDISPYACFLSIVSSNIIRVSAQSQDEPQFAQDFVLSRAFSILASLFGKYAGELDAAATGALQEFAGVLYSWLNVLGPAHDVLSASETGKLVDVLAAVKILADNTATHSALLALRRDGGDLLSSMARLLNTSSAPQIVYLVGYCCWLLSYNEANLPLFKKAKIIELTSKLLVYAKPKAIRVFYYTFKNLLDKKTEGANFNTIMIACDIIKSSNILQGRNDEELRFPELVVAMTAVKERLLVLQQTMNTFEMYQAELTAGKFRKGTPVHSEIFWRENNQKFETKNFASVDALLRLLASPLSDDKDVQDTVEVACSDIGFFCQYYPGGKSFIAKTKIQKSNGAEITAKAFLLELMSSPYPDVARSALMTVQKLLVSNWAFLTMGSTAGAAPPAKRS
jgi:hypothetical protein